MDFKEIGHPLEEQALEVMIDDYNIFPMFKTLDFGLSRRIVVSSDILVEKKGILY